MQKFLFVLVMLFGCCLGQNADAKFVVVDGDSLEYGGERIRLQGIDAPEFMQKCYDANGISIGEKMVRDGFAVSYGDDYQKAEDEAKAYKKGIWKGKFMRPELYRALQKERKTVNKK